MMFELQNSIQKLPGSTPIKADMVQHSLAYLIESLLKKETMTHCAWKLPKATRNWRMCWKSAAAQSWPATEARNIYAKAISLVEPVVARDSQNQRAEEHSHALASCWV